jgi:calcineurin-like phosphoesterase family protein
VFKRDWPKFHGSKRLIVGNHDDIKFLSSGGFFSKVQMWRVFAEHKLLLTHVPVHPDNLKVYLVESEYQEGDIGTVQKQFLNVHGHIHQNASPPGPYFNASAEALNYYPIHIETLASFKD